MTAIGCADSVAPRLCTVQKFHATTNKWRLLVGQPKQPLERWVYFQPHRRPYAVWLWGVRRDRAKAAVAELVQWYESSGAACVHRLEGSWTDPNPEYYGGYQMSLSFQRAHGWQYLARWGTADHWPALVQIKVTRRVVLASGWGQWPSTAAACGLL